MSPLPSEFVGLWERVSIVVDGRLIRDAGRSWWFQAHERFLDVRAAGGGMQTEMFGGMTVWDATAQTLSWSHEIDLHVDARDDNGRVEWIGGDLVEHGTAPSPSGTVEYTEIWRKCGSDAPVIIADRVNGIGRLARLGRLGAVFIDDRPAASTAGGLFTDRVWQWTFDVTIGLPLPSSSTRVPDDIGATFHQFETDWTIVESSIP